MTEISLNVTLSNLTHSLTHAIMIETLLPYLPIISLSFDLKNQKSPSSLHEEHIYDVSFKYLFHVHNVILFICSLRL